MPKAGPIRAIQEEEFMRKKLLSILLSVCMALSLLPTTALADGSSGNWAEHADTSWYNDTDAGFTISTAAQLAGLAALVNDYYAGKNFSGKTVTLTADINLSAHDWTPIGNGYWNCFAGTFDGGGHSVTAMNSSITSGSDIYAGLFGNDNGGTIENVSVAGTVTATTNGSEASVYVGGIAGKASGDNCAIKNCTANVTVTAGITSTEAYSLFAYAGGIVGFSAASVTNCSGSGTITATAVGSNSIAYAGGVAGCSANSIRNSSSSAAVSASSTSSDTTGYPAGLAGGITGANYNRQGTVTNCYNIGSISATVSDTNSNAHAYAGGLVGEDFGAVRNSYTTGSVSAVGAAKLVGAIVGQDHDVQNCYWLAGSAESASGSEYSSLKNCGSFENTSGSLTLSGTESATNKLAASTLLAALNAYVATDTNDTTLKYWDTSTYPVFYSTWTEALYKKNPNYAVTVTGNQANIANAWDLAWLAAADDRETGNTFTLTSDIDLSLYNWKPIAPSALRTFEGTFDGNGHCITNMNVNESINNTGGLNVGLFGILKGTVKNLTVSGSVCGVNASSDSQTAAVCAGGIAGDMAGGSVTGCSYTGSVCSSNHTVSDAGGIVGHIGDASSITGCTAGGAVTAKTRGNGHAEAGGIGGSLSKTAVTDCVYIGSVAASASDSSYNACVGGIVGGLYESSSLIRNCRAAGPVNGTGGCAYVGGIAGMNGGPVENSFHTGTVSGTGSGSNTAAKVGGITGMSETAVSNCYQVGAVSGTATQSGSIARVCGVVGSLNNSVASNCYWLATASINAGLPAAGSGSSANCGSFADNTGALTLSGDASDANKLAAANLSDALNTWVSEQTTPANYQTWVVKSVENGGYPVYGEIWKVTFHANYEGSAETALRFVPRGSAVSSAPAYSREGYLFTAWNTAADGKGTAFDQTAAPAADTEVYAQWDPLVTIRYASADETKGSVSRDTETIGAATGTPQGSTATPAKGYQFVNWTGADGTAVSTSASFTPAKTTGGYAGGTYKANFIVTPSSSNSGGGSTSTSTTTTNSDGSTTTKVTDSSTGTVTETTKATDGTTTAVETKKDGTVTTTETTAAGDKTETVKAADGTVTTTETTKAGDTTSTVKKPDGSMTAAVQQADGTKVEAVTAASGTTTASVTVPAGKTGTTVTIPTPAKPSAGTVAVITKADGTKEIVKASVPTGDGLQVTLGESAAVTLVDNAKTFTDVPADSWAKEGVDYVSARATMNGVGGGSFGGDLPMTRAMAWAVLFRQNVDGAADSSSGQWYDNAQKWAAQQKLSDGSSPDAAITREQLVTTLYRAAGAPTVSGDLSGFADADQVSAYARSAVLWAVQNGILKGSDGKLDPGANATRNQVAAIFMRSDMSAAN